MPKLIAHSRTHRADSMTRAHRVVLRRLNSGTFATHSHVLAQEGMLEWQTKAEPESYYHGHYFDNLYDALEDFAQRARTFELKYESFMIGSAFVATD